MLLGAAKYLAETRNFAGTAIVIFQPAEEGGAGGEAMVKDGLMSRFGIDEVYGMHNYPGLPVGQFGIRPGPIMAAADHIEIKLEGKGGHAARPHLAVDTILVGAQIINALQSIVARNVDPLHSAVVSICMFHAGHTDNVIPQHARLRGTARSLTDAVRALEVATGQMRWEYKLHMPSHSGLMTTAGGLVFGSSLSSFFALDAVKGGLLWRFETGSGIVANPISYMSAGKQYVAIAAGHALLVFGLD